MTPQDIWQKVGKYEMRLLGEGCMGSKKLLPHTSALEGPSSLSANNRSELSDKIYWQASVLAAITIQNRYDWSHHRHNRP